MSDVTVRQYEWSVEGLDCPTCAATLERACAGVPGVLRATASVTAGRLTVTADQHRFDAGALRETARRVGHPLSGDAHPLAPWLPAVAGGVLLLGGLVAEASGGRADPWYLVGAVAGGFPLPARAWLALRQRSLDLHVLMTVALIGAVGLGEWREAALLTVLFAVARGLERGSLVTARRAVASLVELAPARARVERDGEVVEVPTAEVAVGEILRIRPGDAIPLDGEIVAGQASLQQAAVTGESVPVAKGPGDRVFAATLAIDGALSVRVTAVAARSTLARVAELVRQAEQRPSHLARQVDRFAAGYTPIVVAVAVLAMAVPPLFGADAGQWIYAGLVVLVLSCPCALVLATPTAVLSGLSAAARRGVLVRGGDALERLAAAGAIALDKTGTLTSGRPRLIETVALDGEEAELLAIAAGLEQDSSHPLAAALRAAAGERGLLAPPVDDHRAVAGRGVTGTVAGRRYLLGSPRLLAEHGVDGGAAEPAMRSLAERGLTGLVLAGDRPLAVFGLADTPRPEAAEVVGQLRELGLDPVVMLTGDSRPTADAIARQVGLTDARAELLPEDKLAALETLRGPGGVVMVGDGINDAPALAAADVGIAVATAGSAIAMESADVALLGADLRAIPRLVRLARQTRSVILGNIVAVLALRVILLPLGLAGEVSLPVAVLADCGSAVLVTANSLRLLRPR